MALNGKTISARHVIYRAIRDAQLKSHEFSLGTMMEWISEALDLIGCPYAYTDKVYCITIEDHRGTLPCNLFEIKQASILLPSGVQLPIRGANGTFHPLFLTNGAEVGALDYATPVSIDDDGNPVFNSTAGEITLPASTVAVTSTMLNDATYHTNDNYIFTSFKEGAKILMSYRAFPIDEDGFPMIPDNEKFKQACLWHLLMKLYYAQWVKGKVSDAVFKHAEQQRDWYIGAATTAGLMPTLDTMESWKNGWLHLIPRLNEHSTFYRDLGNSEFLKLGQDFNRY